MSSTGRSIYTPNPGTFNATLPGVAIGDLVVDPAGVNPPGLVTGPNNARTVQPLGGGSGLQASAIALTLSNPGGAGTARAAITVTDPGPATPIVGALVQVFVTSPSALTNGVAGPSGAVAASTVGASVAAGSLVILGETGVGGALDVDLTGTNGAAIGVVAIVLNPLPSSVAKNGALAP
jgi:hypothetical protein